jgi:hypothetical protein
MRNFSKPDLRAASQLRLTVATFFVPIKRPSFTSKSSGPE